MKLVNDVEQKCELKGETAIIIIIFFWNNLRITKDISEMSVWAVVSEVVSLKLTVDLPFV